MADRSTNKLYTTSGNTRLRVPIANGVTLPIGSLAQMESGFANHYTGATGGGGIPARPRRRWRE